MRCPAPHSEINWRTGHRAGVSEHANQRGRSDETAYAVSTAKMPCRKVELEEMHKIAFFVNNLPSCYQWKKWWNRIHWRTPVGWDTNAYAYGCSPLRRNGGSVTARNLAAHRSQGTPVQADTRRAWNQESMASRWSEETAEHVVARRQRNECLYEETIVLGGQKTKSERQIAEQVSVLFLLKLKSVISALAILEQTFSLSREHVEANGGSTLLSRLVFRRTIARDQERMATHYSEELQRTTAGCRNSHLKSAPTGHCHTSDGAQTTRTFFFVEGTHVHWQATAEQLCFSKLNMNIMSILKSRKVEASLFIFRRTLSFVSSFFAFNTFLLSFGRSFIPFLCSLTRASSPRATIISSNLSFKFTILEWLYLQTNKSSKKKSSSSSVSAPIAKR